MIELSNWEKLYLMTWKNFCVAVKSYRRLCLAILVPPLFLCVLVFLRFLVSTNARPMKKFRELETTVLWDSMLKIIESRRLALQKVDANFTHNVYVPQSIIAYAPIYNESVDIMNKASKDDLSGIELMQFTNCSTLQRQMSKEHYFAGVCFKSQNDSIGKYTPRYLEYEIIFPSELRIYNDSYIGASWSTNVYFDLFHSNEERKQSSHDGGYVGYVREGFAAVQTAVFMAYIRILKEAYIPAPKVRRFPLRAHIDDPLIRTIRISVSLTLVCGFLLPVANATYLMIKEKEMHVRKTLKSMDVPNWIHFLAWFFKTFTGMAISSIIIVGILKTEWNEGRAIFHTSSPMALIFVLLAFSMAATGFSIMMSSFFNEVSTGVPLTCIIWLASYLPYIASSMNQLRGPYDFQWLVCCFCNTVLGFLFRSITDFENLGDGFSFVDLGKTMNDSTKTYPGIFVGILFALTIIYFLIALYIEEVNPGLHDIPKLWNFIFRPKDHRERSSFRRAQAVHVRQTRVYEIEPEYRKIALKIEGLTKVFNNVAVVKNVTLNLYEGDITVVLGHNAAGKTTLLQMVAGMVRPSKGRVIVQGIDSRHEYLARKRMGICLQEGLMYPELNISDQLTLFARLRGLTMDEIEKDVQKYLDAMRLSERKHDSTHTLSNGEQKFLAVCCALVGNCKIVLLDDPSKGLDAFARKSLWELLRNERKMRTIFITTHSEEETEALGDRVAVLSGGELKCFGSTFFLKKIYGQGHRLICFKGSNFETSALNEVLQNYIPNITPECELGTQVSYTLEDARANTELFDELEERSEELGIQGITIAEIDSGDIFLKMGAENPSEGDRARHTDIMNGKSIYTREYDRLRFMEPSDRLTGFRLFLNHCEVMQIKRFLNSLRLTLLGLLQLIMPILFTIVSFSLLNYQHQRSPLPKLQIQLNVYSESITVFHLERDSKKQDVLHTYNAYSEQLFWLGAPHSSEEVPSGQKLDTYLIEKQKTLIEKVNNKYLVGVSIGDENTVAYFNNFPLHTVPISLNVLFTAMFCGTIDSTGRIASAFTPLSYSSNHNIVLKNVPQSIGNYLAINISFCAGFTWSLCVIFLVRERKENFKLFQFLAGVRGHIFWLNNFIFDFFTIVISSLIVLLTIVLFELDVFMEEETSGAYFLVLIFAGTCMCSFNYFVSVISSNPVYAYIGITIFNIFGTMCYWCYLESFKKVNRKDENASDPFEVIARILPHFSLCNALVKIFDIAELQTICKDEEVRRMSIDLEHCKVEPNCCNGFQVWTYKSGVLSDLTYIIVYGIVGWILLYLNESYPFWRKFLGFSTPEDSEEVSQYEDDSVPEFDYNIHPSIVNEEKFVFETPKNEYKNERVVFNRVGFRKHLIDFINRLTFRIKDSECFVVLGPNACGKSTLIKTLVGRLAMTHGNAYIDGLSINDTAISKLYPLIGYCPQDDLCLTEYTIAEIMRMVSLLRGLNNHDVVDTCDNLAKVLGFHKHVYKKLSVCTPGIKRRFFCACALIGNPKLLLLDEATSCIDIAGRRQLWNIICRLKDRNHSILFTSVVTQDCETIADRVAIMLSGRITLISDPWTLNQEYALGFLLKMKVKRIIVRVPETTEEWVLPSYRTFSANPFLKLATFIENEFPMSKVKDQLGNIVVYFIPQETTTISHIFEVMQRNAFILYVEDFLITRSALSVMFLETIEDERYRQLQLLT